jgi:chromosome segregation and condensation protein ScpB
MELKFILESLLFSSQKPLSMKELRDVLTVPIQGVKTWA